MIKDIIFLIACIGCLPVIILADQLTSTMAYLVLSHAVFVYFTIELIKN